ncbi:MAG: MATE family efflux transporter [Clostridia bacterium]|nr:MATE family efflux transporter [Clostridia bacterium]
MIKDLTNGKPSKLIIGFTLPMLASVIFQQMYTLADFIIAGKFVNIDALAAVGVSGMITFLFMAFATGSNIGISVVISHHFGAKEYEKTKTAVYTALISMTALAALFTVIGLLLSSPLLDLMNTERNIKEPALQYLNIYILGLVFLFLYNVCTGAFSALGDSTTPFIFLAISSVSNIILDAVFVIYFNMGVAGVAWATFICQGFASLAALTALLIRLRRFEPGVRGRPFSFAIFKETARLAVPSILQQSFVSVGNILIMSKVNTFETDFVAAYSSCIKLNTFIINCCMTVGNAVSSYTAQNLGARKPERVKGGFRSGLVIGETIVLLAMAIFMIFPEPVISLFLDTSKPESIQGAIEAGRHFIYIVTPFYVLMTMKITADGVLRGAGAMAEFTAGTFTSLFLRVLFSYVLGTVIGKDGIWWAISIGWVLPCAMSYTFYKVGTWKRKIKKIQN